MTQPPALLSASARYRERQRARRGARVDLYLDNETAEQLAALSDRLGLSVAGTLRELIRAASAPHP